MCHVIYLCSINTYVTMYRQFFFHPLTYNYCVLQAYLLVVDDNLLKLIAMDALGDQLEEASNIGIAAWLLSFWLSGKCL